jgi:dTDP-4-dehydrorhamnose reductase
MVAKLSPDLIINCAAYNKLEEAEVSPLLALQVNTAGPHNLACVAALHDIPVMHISTDYVFDGAKGSGYEEGDAVSPINVYGVSKEAGEKLVRIANDKHWIVRTSALFGINAGNGKGYNFVTRMISLGKEKGSVRVVGDQNTAPTYTHDLALGLKQMVLKKIPYGTYHLVNEGSATWYEFAEAIFNESHMDVAMTRITTAESGTKLKRPTYSVLLNRKLKAAGIVLPEWRDGLKRYLKEINQ